MHRANSLNDRSWSFAMNEKFYRASGTWHSYVALFLLAELIPNVMLCTPGIIRYPRMGNRICHVHHAGVVESSRPTRYRYSVGLLQLTKYYMNT